MRAHGDENGDKHWYPFTDGLIYWNETMLPLPEDLDPDILYANGNMIGWVQDTMVWQADWEDLAWYINSMSSMPTILVDEDEQVFVVWSGVTSLRDPDNYMYRHLYARVSSDNGQTWNDNIEDLTSEVIFTGMECVYPTLSPTSTEKIYLQFQQDENAGVYIFGGQGQSMISNNEMVILDPEKNFIVGIGERKIQHTKIRIQNYPNPFTSSATIEFELDQPGNVEISMVNQFGQVVDHILHNGSTGINKVTWDAGSLPAGVYVCRITAGKETGTQKLVLVR